MPVLDRYLEALRMPGAQAITFKSGLPVEILANGSVRTVNNAVPTGEQLVSILSEILPPDFRDTAQGPKDYPYQSPLGPVKITVQVAGANVVARVMPWTGPAPAAPPPAPPAAPAPAPSAAPPSGGYRPAPAAQPPAAPRKMGKKEGSKKPANMDELFNPMLDLNASDLHLKTNKQPMIRLHGEMEWLEGFAPLSQEELWKLLSSIMPPRNLKEYESTHDTDFAYEMDRARMRCNVFKDIVGIGAVFRQIPTKIQSVKELRPRW